MGLSRLAFTVMALMFLVTIGAGKAWSCGGESCHVSATAGTEPGDPNEASVKTTAQCYTACVERYGDIVLPGVAYVSNGGWYSVPYSVLESLGCQTVQKVLECQSGCMLMATGKLDTVNSCRDLCFDNCDFECSTEEDMCSYNISEITCHRNCRKPSCRFGCEEFADFANPVNETLIAPLQPLEITLVNASTSEYSVQTEEGAPTEGSPLTAFIFKITKDSKDRYLFKPSLEENLTLAYYACQEVDISYAAINKNGMSAYSSAQPYCILGEQLFPGQVEAKTIHFSYSEDPRPGYLEVGNVVVNVSWEPPVGLEFLSNYTMFIDVGRPDCGKELMYSRAISWNVTWYIYEAESMADAPLFNCEYRVFLISMPIEPDVQPPNKTMFPSLDLETPPMNYSCRRNFSDGDDFMSILVTWSVDEITILSIKNFKVSLLIGEQEEESFAPYSDINPYTQESENGHVSYSHSYTSLPAFEVGSSIQYKVTILPVKGDLYYYWRPIPFQVECYIDAARSPAPPSRIDKDFIFVSDISEPTNTSGMINISWSPPNNTHGNITEYQLLFGAWPAQDDSNLNQYSVLNISGDVTFVSLNMNALIPPHLSCNFVQVRSNNGYLWSSWSEAISLFSYVLNCLTLLPSPSSSQLSLAIPTSKPVTTAGTSIVITPSTQSIITESSVITTTTEEVLLQYILFGVIALITALLFVTIACLVVVCAWCLMTRHQKQFVPEVDNITPTKEGFQLSISDTSDPVEVRKENIYSSIPINSSSTTNVTMTSV